MERLSRHPRRNSDHVLRRSEAAPSDDIGRYFGRMAMLDHAELAAVIAASDAQDPDEVSSAVRRADEATARETRTHQIQDLRDAIISWAADAGPGTGQLSGFAIGETLEANLRRRAAFSLINGAVAVALGNELDSRSATTLLAAWRSIDHPRAGGRLSR